MKFTGGLEIGPLTPKIASWMRCPGRASRVSTTRLGALKPLIELAARLPQHQREPPIHPDLGVVVDHQLEHHGRAGHGKPTDIFRKRDRRAIPVEREAAVGAPAFQRGRLDGLPRRVVVVRGFGVRADVVGANGGAGRLQVGSGGVVIDFRHPHVAVAPGGPRQRGAFLRPEVHDRRRQHRRYVGRYLGGAEGGHGGCAQHRPEGRRGTPEHHGAPAAVWRPAWRTFTT